MNLKQFVNIPVTFVMRHAEKQSAANLSITEELNLNLTTRGKNATKKLGETINETFPSITIYSSPIKRCLATAKILSLKNQIKTNHLLGDPGAFIYNKKLAAQYFVNNNPSLPYIKILQGKKFAGMRSIKQGTNLLLNFMLSKIEKTVNLYITHDSIMALFLAAILPISMLEKSTWPNYLEIAIITKEHNNFFCYWRNEKYPIIKDYADIQRA